MFVQLGYIGAKKSSSDTSIITLYLVVQRSGALWVGEKFCSSSDTRSTYYKQKGRQSTIAHSSRTVGRVP